MVLANSAELSDLSRDEGVDHLSGDLPVRTSTLISDGSTMADQTRAGDALAGLLGIPGVDGRGIGVAVVDSGIAPHSALANRVVVIDAMSNDVVKTFDDVGKYPWTVTIPQGQNYCH